MEKMKQCHSVVLWPTKTLFGGHVPLPCAWLTHAPFDPCSLFEAVITGPLVSSERADFIKIQ